MTIWTIGHSNRSQEDFIDLLKRNGIARLVDIRKLPGSKKNPHFNGDNLARELSEAGIDYVWMPELGGLRKPHPDSHNTAWRNPSFRGYADYMETDAFQQAIERLIAMAKEKQIAIMCSEAVWWRCHRGLVSDYLKSTGVDVIHILGEGKTETHPYTPAAKIVDGKLSYEG